MGGIGYDGPEGEEVAALDGGAARPTRLVGFFALDGGASLGPAAFVFTRLPFVAAAWVTAGAATAAAGAWKRGFAARFLFLGMVAEIMAVTSPSLG